MIKFIEKLETLPDENGISTAEKGENLAADAQNSRSEYILDNISAQDFTQRTGLPTNYRKTIAAFKDIIDPPTAEKAENVTHHASNSKTSRSKYILDNISAQDFTQQTGLPARYRKTVAAYEDIVEGRNNTCHNTQFEFARLLLTRQFKDPVMAREWNCDHWSTLLLWVTGYATLEDMKKVTNVVKLPTIL